MKVSWSNDVWGYLGYFDGEPFADPLEVTYIITNSNNVVWLFSNIKINIPYETLTKLVNL